MKTLQFPSVCDHRQVLLTGYIIIVGQANGFTINRVLLSS